MSEFSFDGVPYRLVRSPRRKRLGLVIGKAGAEVRIPQRCAAQHGHQFFRENIDWVRQQLLRASERAAEIPEHQFAFGEYFPWLDQSLPLMRVARPVDSGIDSHGIRLYLRAKSPDSAQIRLGLQRLYQREALALLANKSERLAALLGLLPAAIKVRRTRSKWGHCTARGELQYNWLVCLGPEPVVDYLVAHEVCHLRHHDHSQAFWQLVEQVCPDYRVHRQWLRQQGHRLHL